MLAQWQFGLHQQLSMYPVNGPAALLLLLLVAAGVPGMPLAMTSAADVVIG
jgi:hypothetical protein